jgi:hypothetical protein
MLDSLRRPREATYMREDERCFIVKGKRTRKKRRTHPRVFSGKTATSRLDVGTGLKEKKVSRMRRKAGEKAGFVPRKSLPCP